MLRACSLSKTYPIGVRALDDLSLEISDGKLYCLLGANGAGKSTTIGCFLDFIRPTSGRAEVDGIEVASKPIEAKRRCAFVAESVALYETASALENLRFFVRLAGLTVSAAGAARALQEAGLDERDHRRLAGECSKGMRQKIGIAIAMTRGATNLLLDEPTSGLDPQAAAELMTTLCRLRDDGHAILMSTHDVARVAENADMVGIMHGGVLRTEIFGRRMTSQSLQQEFARCSATTPPE